MSSKTVTETKPDPEVPPTSWQPSRERAPSFLREDDPGLPRFLGMLGLLCVVLGTGLLLRVSLSSVKVITIGPLTFGKGLAAFFNLAGIGLMLFHAAFDKELQFRRIYGLIGFACLLLGVGVSSLPYNQLPPGTLFLPWGFTLMFVALLFLLPVAHNETEPAWRDRTVRVLGLVGAALALVAFVGGNLSTNFLLPYGVLIGMLGWAYLWAYVGLEGTTNDLAHRVALAMGVLGVLAILVALGRAALPPLFYSWGWTKTAPFPYLVPDGLLLAGLGVFYAGLSAGISTDNRLIVLTRRELAAFFYSPIAYIVLVGFTAIVWVQYYQFLELILESSRGLGGGQPLVEPIIQYYIIHWWPVISMIFIVPVLTMRLMSEEWRTGSLEVLLTAPLDEASIVLSKFLASLLFFLVVCLPWGLFLIALRVQGEQPFDYRPLLSFFIALTATGAAFLSVGLFFSSLTRYQIIAAIFTFAVMFLWTILFFVKQNLPLDSAWRTILTHVSWVDLWIESVQGTLSPRFLVFFASTTLFWLFCTVKVLESRKWS